MRKAIMLGILAVFLPAICPALAHETYDQEMARLTAGMPKDVADFIPRRPGCQHWAGEYSGDDDPARLKEINEAMAKLGCDRLDADDAALQARYKGNAAVLQRLKDVRTTFGEGD